MARFNPRIKPPFGPGRPHPHHRSTLLQYLFPHSVRQRYRERLLAFRLDALPHYKHRLQSRIWGFLVAREQRRRTREGTRLVDALARHGRRANLLLRGPGLPPRQQLHQQHHRGHNSRRGKEEDASASPGRGVEQKQTVMASQRGYYGYGSGGGGGIGGVDGYGVGSDSLAQREPGARRKKLAAMAGSVYRAGVAAASELKEQYNNTRVRGVEMPDSDISIPGSFPDVAIVTKGNEQMVLFPSYAKHHIKQSSQERSSNLPEAPLPTQGSMNDEEYWRQEWARIEDEKAIVDVDVRGWIYTPQKGQMTRRNRMLVGLARRLSGIPPPLAQGQQPVASMHEEHERMREEQKIAEEAREIERKGQGEKEIASRGGYSEPPKDSDDEVDTPQNLRLPRTRNGIDSPPSVPPSPTLAPKASWGAQPAELTEAELAVANANLMARLGPFMTTPLVQLPVTLFFYNDTQSQSRTVMTNDAGHFVMRAALDFVPTHVRTLANENLSATEPVRVIESSGVSVISDIDDTIKHSNISLGAREIFRNTFLRDLSDLTIEGVREWYTSLHDMGVEIHYCSNSPWQLYPVLATFFRLAGLPPGSIQLKQYSGMLQGIFEPVAERKRGSVEKILRDFPERKFLLIGDSGEADLEVYTDLVVSNPNRILAVFIRDVTTPDQPGYFDASFNGGGDRGSRSETSRNRIAGPQSKIDDPAARPALPPRVATTPPRPEGPVMGTLIDLSAEPEEMTQNESQNLPSLKDNSRLKTSSSTSNLPGRKAPPPRPEKPLALRSSPSEVSLGSSAQPDRRNPQPPPNPRVRKLSGPQSSQHPHPLTQIQNSSDQSIGSSASRPRPTPPPRAASNSSTTSSSSRQQQQQVPPPPPPRRRGTTTPTGTLLNPIQTPALPTPLPPPTRANTNSDVDAESLPDAAYQPQYQSQAAAGPGAAVNRKLDVWRRRLARAHETLDRHGVALYTWRKGLDVVAEAEGIVREAMRGMGGGKR